MRRGMTGEGNIMIGNALLRLALDTVPGRSAIGSALRDHQVWPNASDLLWGRVNLDIGIGVTLFGLQFKVEEIASREKARRCEERHIAMALAEMGGGPDGLARFVQPKRLIDAVTLLELGPAFRPSEIVGRWHGLIDTSIEVEYQDLHSIDWPGETGQKAVTIWISPVLLNELDDMKFHSRNERVRRRAQVFSRWVQPLLADSTKPGGVSMPQRPGVVLRAWAPAIHRSTPDGRHLEAAYAVLDRQVPIKLVTGDNGQRLRALANGVEVFELDDRWLVPRSSNAVPALESDQQV